MELYLRGRLLWSYISQTLKQIIKEHGITLSAYSPFGSPDRPWAKVS